MNRDKIDSVIRSLRRVNLQGSFFGQTVAIRFGLSESDVDALELLIDTGAATAGRLAELRGLTTGADDYLVKAHFILEEIVEKVTKVIAKRYL